jgi:class 3 adenylate cyclase
MEPRIQYAKTSDGVNIAYAVFGSGPPAIVNPSNIWGNLHQYKNGTGFNPVDELTALGWSILTYDGRGSGSSDRDVIDFSMEARLRDLEAVIEAAAPDRFATLSYLQATPTSIVYSARNVGRVACMALVNPFASGRDQYRLIPSMRLSHETLDMVDDEWEFHLITLANAVAGYSDVELAARIVTMFQAGMSPRDYVAYQRAAIEIDVADLLPQLRVPTLVILDQAITRVANASLVKGVASTIPGARFVETEDGAKVIDEFLRECGLTPSTAPPELPSGMSAILFADIVDSTALTERLGDMAFREKARGLDEAMRKAIRENGGTPVEGKTLGDGVLAVFTSAKQAIACAQACHEAASAAGLSLHAGIHAGDVIREADPDGRGNVYGGAVNIAARVAAASAAGETLVSATVRDLARTSAGVTFEDRGEQSLKGVGEPVRVFAVRQA